MVVVVTTSGKEGKARKKVGKEGIIKPASSAQSAGCLIQPLSATKPATHGESVPKIFYNGACHFQHCEDWSMTLQLQELFS